MSVMRLVRPRERGDGHGDGGGGERGGSPKVDRRGEGVERVGEYVS